VGDHEKYLRCRGVDGLGLEVHRDVCASCKVATRVIHEYWAFMHWALCWVYVLGLCTGAYVLGLMSVGFSLESIPDCHLNCKCAMAVKLPQYQLLH
jgi:hypothetical protein